MVRVLATGTFEIIHPGHLLYLEEAKKLGDELVVIVSRGVNVKHKPKPTIPEEQRLKIVSALKIVDKAILGSEDDMFEPLYELKPDIIALGYNQNFDEEELSEALSSHEIDAKVVRIKKFDPSEFCSCGNIVKKIKSKSISDEKRTAKEDRIFMPYMQKSHRCGDIREGSRRMDEEKM
jgi:FAD synthetase